MSCESLTTGQRIRLIRQKRGQSLQVVADLSGISKSQLSLLERGDTTLDSMKQLVAIAKALRISPSDLTNVPIALPTDGEVDSAVEDTRCALEEVANGQSGGTVCSVGSLLARVDEVYRLRSQCQLREVGAVLPQLIRDIHRSITAGRDVPELLPLAVRTHVWLTGMWLRDAGAPMDLRRQVSWLARELAEDHGAPVTLGVAMVGTVEALLGSGMFPLAASLLERFPLPAVDPGSIRLVGELVLESAMVAALEGRPGDTVEPLRMARELAMRVGEPTALYDEAGSAFGPTDVGLYEMDIAMEAGEPELALRVAETLRPGGHPWVTRRAAFWVWRGQAFSKVRGHREDALLALRKAEKLSPHHVYRNPFARDALLELLARSQRDAVGSELRAMAFRAGIPV